MMIRKLIASALIAGLSYLPQTVLADGHLYLALANDSGFKIKTVEGNMLFNTYYNEAYESSDHWYWFSSSIGQLVFSYQNPETGAWEPLKGCTSRWWYDHSVTVTFVELPNKNFPVCRIRIH
jgi:hypothetical protein